MKPVLSDRTNSPARPRHGFVLLAVLVVVVLLTLAAYQFSELMLAEYRAADSSTRSAQAQALADSGIAYTAALLSNPDAFANTLNGNPFENAQAFQAVPVNPQDPPRLRGRFSIVAPLDPGGDSSGVSQGYRFGVTDESGKINLNALMRLDSSGKVAHDMLMALPNMTEAVANAILDWIDPDDEPRPDGAENEYYSTLSPPYRCKNGPLDSLEELLFVKGVTPQLLLGNDRNRNGILDPDEEDGSGVLDRGWSAYLTVYSREQNVDAQGNPRIYLNGRDLNKLSEDLTTALGQDLANYIVAYRLYGPASDQPRTTPGRGNPGAGSGQPAAPRPAASPAGSGAGPGPSAGSGTSGPAGPAARLSRDQLNLQSGRPRSISSLLELVNSSVSIPGNNPQAPPTRHSSPLNDAGTLRQLLPQLLDKTTTVNQAEIPARININTAPLAVLMALPGISESDAQSILEHRPSSSSVEPPDPVFGTPAWLITEANFKPETLRGLERYITARTQVYRAQVVGYFESSGPRARVEVVIDANQGLPRVVYRRDLTELGRGFNLESSDSGRGSMP